jgi:hypothetical protein
MASVIIRTKTGQEVTVNTQITTVMKHLEKAASSENQEEFPGGFARWDTDNGSFAVRLSDVESLTGVK